MLFAKIDPIATFTQNTGPFTAPIAIQAEYFTALARPYAAGALQTNFEVSFGNIVKNEEEKPIGFNQVSNISLTLTKEQLADWGTNDDALLEIIAENIGTTITEFVTLDNNGPF